MTENLSLSIHLQDTRPTHRISQTTPPIPISRRRSCLPRLLMIFLLLLGFVGGLMAGGFVLWRWSATLPRTNLLLLGLDRRPEEGDTVRSDSMILVGLDPQGPHVALLSIPRDLYVQIPGHGTNRINSAHFWGESDAPGGGPALAMQTVEQNLGVTVHHYVRLDFDGFRAIVDAVGGIDVVVEETIVDDAYPTEDYGTMRIEIPTGPQHMDGETALRYVRSRHGSSDFDRAARQQQILLGLAHHLTEPSAWPRLPLVYNAVTSAIDTDMTNGELLLLLPTIYRTGPENVAHRIIDRDMTQPWTTPTGGAVLLPRWEAIHPLVQELFTPQTHAQRWRDNIRLDNHESQQ